MDKVHEVPGLVDCFGHPRDLLLTHRLDRELDALVIAPPSISSLHSTDPACGRRTQLPPGGRREARERAGKRERKFREAPAANPGGRSTNGASTSYVLYEAYSSCPPTTWNTRTGSRCAGLPSSCGGRSLDDLKFIARSSSVNLCAARERDATVRLRNASVRGWQMARVRRTHLTPFSAGLASNVSLYHKSS